MEYHGKHRNHNQSLANVRIQWAAHGELEHNASLLLENPEQMYPIASPGLVWDYVATRDIAAGEELFLDYGSAWDEAWQKHVDEWNADQSLSETYQSAREWNIANANTPLLTQEEQKEAPYPDHFAFRCLKEAGVMDLTSGEANQLWGIRTVGLPCTIHARKQDETKGDGMYTYTIHFLPDAEYEDDLQELGLGLNEKGELWWMEMDNVPREAIRAIDLPYTNDLFLKQAFRHFMEIPNDMFPTAWRGFNSSGVW